MGNFSGMFFTLKKREDNMKEDDSYLYKQLMLGYYDGLDIYTVDEWYSLRPKGLLERNLQIEIDSPYIDQYTIRAFVPDNSDELDKLGFSYELWKEIGRISAKDYEKHMQEIRENYPFVCMSLINVTEEFVKAQNGLEKMQGMLIQTLQNCVNTAGCNLHELHCAVFPSIGYSDFIIVFMTDNLKQPADIINKMKNVTVEEKVTMISSCYSICGFDKSYRGKVTEKSDPNIKISMRINFQTGVSTGYFLKCLKSEELSGKDNQTLKEFIGEYEKNYYITFGNSDCLILPNQSLEQCLKWYGKGNILNPSNPLFSKYIANVRTSVNVIGDEIAFEESVQTNTVNMEFYEETFKAFIKEYNSFLKKSKKPIRSSRAMSQIMKNFLNVAKSSHGFDIRQIVGDTFQSMIKNMTYYMNLEERKDTSEMSEETKNENHEYNYKIKKEKNYIVEVQNEFKEFMGVFISDLIRSDRPFIEGNVLTHSSIGSATKLLFGYSGMLRKMLKECGMENKFSFLVSSGGCDRTEAIDLFDFADRSSDIKKPIFIIIPEMSLYDVQGTLFRILHEYMHFIGDRKRKERYRCIVNALSKYIAWEIAELDFNSQRKNMHIEKAIYHLPTNMKNELKKDIENKWQALKKEVQEKIAKEISSERVFSDYESNGEEAFYAATLKESVLHIESIVDIFSVTEIDFANEKCNNIQKKIYTILYNADEQFVEFIKDKLEKIYSDNSEKGKSSLLPLQSYEMLLQNYKYRDSNPKEYDIKLKKFIEQYMDSLLRNFPLNTGGSIVFQAKYDYETILNEIIAATIETFSDCAAVNTIDMKIEDFLLSFIYEIWDINQALPKTVGNTLRIGADLQILYGVTGKLNDDVKNRVRKKVMEREKQGYKHRYEEEMLERIDDILQGYSFPEFEGVRGEIENYLRQCVDHKDEWYSKELGELYKICDMKDSEEIYQVVDKIIDLWKSLSGEY